MVSGLALGFSYARWYSQEDPKPCRWSTRLQLSFFILTLSYFNSVQVVLRGWEPWRRHPYHLSASAPTCLQI